MPSLREIVLELLAWCTVAVLAGLPVGVLWWHLKQRALPPQRHVPVAWSGVEVFLSFLALAVWPVLIHLLRTAGRSNKDAAPNPAESLLDSVLAFPLLLATFLALLSLAHVAHAFPLSQTLYRFGLHRFRAGIITGYLAWLIVSPAVFVVHFVTLLAYHASVGAPPEEHPLVKAIQQQPTVFNWVLIFLNAVVVAPLVEEVLFRGLLQFWLSRAGRIGDIVAAAALAVPVMEADQHWKAPVLFVSALLPGYFTAGIWARRWLPRPGAARAIYGSAMLFAAFHSSYWPTPVPLFVLGLGLGYLAYRTQSLVGPVCLHALFNGVACSLLVLTQAAAAESGKGKATTSAERVPPATSISTAVPDSWLPRRT